MEQKQQFYQLLKSIEEPFSGWDFSFIIETGRMNSSLLSWSYGSMAIPLVETASSLLDMGTGGGEFLSKLQPFPPVCVATEGYKPNVSVAKQRLTPLGVTVVAIEEDGPLPFENDQFAVILNRHEAYDPQEVKRVMKRGGLFLTQQVGGFDCIGINKALGVSEKGPYAHWNVIFSKEELERHGFTVLLAKEEFPHLRFYDVGALIYYLKAVSWQVPNFTVDAFKDQLYDIYLLIEEKGFFEVKQHRFIIKATIN